MTDEEPAAAPRFARLLDLRFVLTAMFTIFGVLVTGSGLFVDDADLQRAAGLNISLWTGIALLVLAAAFGVWLIRVPPDVPKGHEAADDQPDVG
jgi:hypothetical protein